MHGTLDKQCTSHVIHDVVKAAWESPGTQDLYIYDESMTWLFY